jgi:hypothetical protein
MSGTATVVRGPGETWVVVVTQPPWGEQRYECWGEKKAEALAHLFSEQQRPKPARKRSLHARRHGLLAFVQRIGAAATAGLLVPFPFMPSNWRRSSS